MVEPQETDELVETANTGLGEELEAHCRRYTDDQHKQVCIETTRNTIGMLATGLNEESRRNSLRVDSTLKQVGKNIDAESPERIPTPPIGEVKVYKKR